MITPYRHDKPFSRQIEILQNQPKLYLSRLASRSLFNPMIKLELIFQRGDIVFAKCPGIEPWPAIITSILPDFFIYNVRFYNHRSTAYIQQQNLTKFTEPIAKKYLKLYKNSQDNTLIAISRGIQKALVQFQKKQKMPLIKTSKSRSRQKIVATSQKKTNRKVEIKIQKPKQTTILNQESNQKKQTISKNKSNQKKSLNSVSNHQNTYSLRSHSFTSPSIIITPTIRKEKIKKLKTQKKQTSTIPIVISSIQNDKSKPIQSSIQIHVSKQQTSEMISLTIEPYLHINNLQEPQKPKIIEKEPNQQNINQKLPKIQIQESMQSIIQSSHHKSMVQPCLQQKQQNYQSVICTTVSLNQKKEQSPTALKQVEQNSSLQRQIKEKANCHIKECEQDEIETEIFSPNLTTSVVLNYLNQLKKILIKNKQITINKSLIKQQYPIKEQISIKLKQICQENTIRQDNLQSQNFKIASDQKRECMIKIEEPIQQQTSHIDWSDGVLITQNNFDKQKKDTIIKAQKDVKRQGIKMQEEMQAITISIQVVDNCPPKTLKQQQFQQNIAKQQNNSGPISQNLKIECKQKKQTKIQQISELIESLSIILEDQKRKPSEIDCQPAARKPIKRQHCYSNFRQEHKCNEYAAILSGVPKFRIVLLRRSPQYICNLLKKYLKILIKSVSDQGWGISVGLPIKRKQVFFAIFYTEVLTLKEFIREKCIDLMLEFFYKFKSSYSLMKRDCHAQFQLIKTKLSLYSYQFMKNCKIFQLSEEQKMQILQQFTKYDSSTSK